MDGTFGSHITIIDTMVLRDTSTVAALRFTRILQDKKPLANINLLILKF